MVIVIIEVIELANTEYPYSLGLATVTPFGLKFKEQFYSNTNMIKHGWFELAEQDEGWQIPIFYDPKDVSRIMLIDIDSIRNAFPIEVVSRKIDPEMKELYFSAIESLKKRIRQNKNKL